MAIRFEIMATLWQNETRCGDSELIHSGETEKPHELWFDGWVRDYLRQQDKRYTWKDDRSFSLFFIRENGSEYWVTTLWASEAQREVTK